MQNTFNQSWIWKAGAIVAAIALVIGILVYTGGYQNFLKLLGIKAGTEQSILLTSTTQMLGSSQDGWIVTGSAPVVDGTGVFDSFSLVPTDTGEAGLVMSIFSSPNVGENTYTTHIYESPVIDLGTDTPLLSAMVITQHAATGATINYSYATAATAEGIATSTYNPIEIAGNGEDGMQTLTAQIGVPASRFIRLKAEFLGDSFDSRSAIYSWDIQYSDGGASSDPSNSVADTTNVSDPAAKYPVAIDFSQATGTPAFVDLSLYNPALGSDPVWSSTAQSAASLQPISALPEELASGGYVLVISGPGYEAQILPFAVVADPVTVTVKTFLPIPANFDLNGDGSINTLDVSLLFTKIGGSTEQ